MRVCACVCVCVFFLSPRGGVVVVLGPSQLCVLFGLCVL